MWNIGQPVNWGAPLNRGLLAWWLRPPVQVSTVRFLDMRQWHHATLTGGPSWGGPSHTRSWGSLVLDGSNDYGAIGDPVSLRPAASLTISAWFKTSMTTRGMMLSSYNGNLTLAQLEIGRNTAGYVDLSIRTGTGSGTTTEYTGATYHDGAWHQVVGTHDDNVQDAIYVDGKQVLTGSAASGSMNGETQNWCIGCENGGSNFFNGALNDIRLYNRVLSASEVAMLYQAGKSGYTHELNWLRPIVGKRAAAAGGRTTRNTHPWSLGIELGMRIGMPTT